MSKIIKFCSWCGSHDIVIDATGVWNVDTQDWEALAFDETNAQCNECCGDTSVEDKEVLGTDNDQKL